MIEKFLEKISGARIVQLRSKTELRMKKNPVFPHGITKISSRVGIIGANYENCVNNQLRREGEEPEFKAESLWGGKGRRVSRFIVEHSEKGDKYIPFLPSGETKNIYIDNGSGLEVEYEAIKQYLPTYKLPANQGTEKPVLWQTINVDNVLGIKCGELEYNV